MAVGRKLAELQAECERLGLVLSETRRSKPGKQNYVDLLQKYYLDTYEAEGRLTPCQKWIHENMESPKLATSATQVKPGVEDEYYNDPNVGIQEKADGCRILIAYDPEQGFGFYSRNRSVIDYCFGNYTDQIKGFERPLFKGVFKNAFILDAELVSNNPNIKARMNTETQLEAVTAILALNRDDSWKVQAESGYPLRFRVFDILMFGWKSVMTRPYWQRDEICTKICNQLVAKAEEFPEIQ